MRWEVERVDGWIVVACGGVEFFVTGLGILSFFFRGRSADDSQVYSYDVVFCLLVLVLCLWDCCLSVCLAYPIVLLLTMQSASNLFPSFPSFPFFTLSSFARLSLSSLRYHRILYMTPRDIYRVGSCS